MIGRYFEVTETSNFIEDGSTVSFVAEQEFTDRMSSSWARENRDGSYTYADPDSEVVWTIRARQVRR